jgi:hypothetical protein
LKQALKTLFGEHGATDEAIRAELDTLKTEGLVEELTREGRLPADPDTQEIARRFAAHDPDGLAALLRAPRPAPAAVATVTPPGPADADPTETAIRAHAEATGKPYHEAATEISRGGRLNA